MAVVCLKHTMSQESTSNYEIKAITQKKNISGSTSLLPYDDLKLSYVHNVAKTHNNQIKTTATTSYTLDTHHLPQPYFCLFYLETSGEPAYKLLSSCSSIHSGWWYCKRYIDIAKTIMQSAKNTSSPIRLSWYRKVYTVTQHISMTSPAPATPLTTSPAVAFHLWHTLSSLDLRYLDVRSTFPRDHIRQDPKRYQGPFVAVASSSSETFELIRL